MKGSIRFWLGFLVVLGSVGTVEVTPVLTVYHRMVSVSSLYKKERDNLWLIRKETHEKVGCLSLPLNFT